ncbi:putative receptor protein kinase ZmPK1 [Hordeum vulgare]|nr:putative receptor protein kinase ZmPK1 [Hordeum vulgare]
MEHTERSVPCQGSLWVQQLLRPRSRRAAYLSVPAWVRFRRREQRRARLHGELQRRPMQGGTTRRRRLLHGAHAQHVMGGHAVRGDGRGHERGRLPSGVPGRLLLRRGAKGRQRRHVHEAAAPSAVRPRGGGYALSVKTGGAANPTPGGSGRDTNHRSVGVGRATTIALVCIGVLACVALSALIASARLLRANWRILHRHVALANADAGEGLEEETAPLRSYTYQELERATHSFRDPLGRGAFGTVFKGALRNGEKVIAVKRLEKLVEDGEREFQREVRAIGRTSHRNLVRLLGFCHEGASRLLVYEFMSNGSVADLLFKGGASRAPAWPGRLGIALDVARGLHYLHDELDSRVIHCDVKPQNILMDAAGTAKIADFGLAKLLQPDQTRTFTGVRGTRGYLHPSGTGAPGRSR